MRDKMKKRLENARLHADIMEDVGIRLPTYHDHDSSKVEKAVAEAMSEARDRLYERAKRIRAQADQDELHSLRQANADLQKLKEAAEPTTTVHARSRRA